MSCMNMSCLDTAYRTTILSNNFSFDDATTQSLKSMHYSKLKYYIKLKNKFAY